MIEHFNELDPSEAERLALLAEECSEVVQAVMKILRHGYESTTPDDSSGFTNRQRLSKEIGDVEAAVNLMTGSNDLIRRWITSYRNRKRHEVLNWLHHN